MKKIVFIAIALLVVGCSSTPTGNIEAFAVAAANVTEKIDAVISEYNAANINDELVTLAGFSKETYSRPSFDPLREIIIKGSNKKDFALYKANKALWNYAKSISVLAKAGSREELAMAGVALSTSLKTMNDQYKSLKETPKDLISDDDGATISRIVSELASFYVERKRAEYLKEIIIAADGSVQSIGKVINEQLFNGVIVERLYSMRGSVVASLFSEYNSKLDKSTFSKRKEGLELIYPKYVLMESSAATVTQAQKAISSVMKAHSKIKAELENDRFSSKKISEAINNIKAVHGSFDDLEELIQNCETEVISDSVKGIICKD